ncbi:MAG: hypothetical protein KJP16_02160 [Gammaproteobacteria bacterium]|nr:hypothetical protein [Gammaproteobacteria bacterium]NNC57391.1 hypothetical protein [Woeseiaceae bacterium]NNL49593.1 hypothetical protein [Woeseiaceae bacterium]
MSRQRAGVAKYDVKPPLKWVTKDELRPGDVLFSSSVPRKLLGRIIWLGQVLDGVGYSHCGIYDGDTVIETTLKEGVAKTPIDKALVRNRYTDIFRFLADDGKNELGRKDWPSRPIIRFAGSFVGRGYAVSDAVVAALLLITKKTVYADLPTSNLIRKTLNIAVRFLHDKLSQDPPARHLTCSELVYRSFDDAVDSRKYRITVEERPYESVRLPSVEEGTDTASGEFVNIPIFKKMSFASLLSRSSVAKSDDQMTISSEIQNLAAEFETLYRQVNYLAGPVLVPAVDGPDGDNAFNIKFETVADYVSPGDLVRSRNTREIGRIEKPSRGLTEGNQPNTQ